MEEEAVEVVVGMEVEVELRRERRKEIGKVRWKWT